MRTIGDFFHKYILVFGLFGVIWGCQKKNPQENTKIRVKIGGEVPCVKCKTKVKGFVLWMSDDASHVALVVFNEDTNKDGEIESKIGEHGELLADRPKLAWVNTSNQKVEMYDRFLGSDARNRFALLKKDSQIFLVNGKSGKREILKGAEGIADFSNPCLPSREAVLDAAGTRVVFPLGPKSYRSYNIVSKKTYDISTGKLLWRVRPKGSGEEVFEIVKDRDGDGLHFPKSQSTCACEWCPRFARSVGDYGSRGDEISRSFYYSGEVRKLGKAGAIAGNAIRISGSWPGVESMERDCKFVGSTSHRYVIEECGHTLFRTDTKVGIRKRIKHRMKLPSYENQEVEGWLPILVIGTEGLEMGRYNVESNRMESGPSVSKYSKLTHSSGDWLGTKNGKGFVWSVSNKVKKSWKVPAKITTLNGLVVNTEQGKYLVDVFTGRTRSIPETPSFYSSNGRALFRAQTHRITFGPWELW